MTNEHSISPEGYKIDEIIEFQVDFDHQSVVPFRSLSSRVRKELNSLCSYLEKKLYGRNENLNDLAIQSMLEVKFFHFSTASEGISSGRSDGMMKVSTLPGF